MTTSFSEIYDRAVARHGEDNIRAHFHEPVSADVLRAETDDRYLAAMAKRVFAAGFRWSVVQAKWDGFEAAFHDFDPHHVANLDEEGIGALAADTRIVRNRPKIISTINNAKFVVEISDEFGGFGNWLADWPVTDVVGLWAELKKRGDRLGGNTGAWFLRLVGKDTFRLSEDVMAALKEAGVDIGKGTGKRHQANIQAAFNQWQAESGLSMGALSMTLARSTGMVR
jgi:3-methyladenine DNA glycosylase Tag